MISRFALVFVAAAAAGVCGGVLPASAQGVGVGVGPVGVTVGADPYRDHDRDHTTTVIKKDHDNGDRDKTIIIKKDHDQGS